MDTRESNPFDDAPLPPSTPPTPEEEAAQEAVYWMLEHEVCGLCQDPSPGDLPHPHQPPVPDHCPTAPTDYHADYPCECGGPASYATGYCRPCEAQRGIPPAFHLSPEATHELWVTALRSLGHEPPSPLGVTDEVRADFMPAELDRYDRVALSDCREEADNPPCPACGSRYCAPWAVNGKACEGIACDGCNRLFPADALSLVQPDGAVWCATCEAQDALEGRGLPPVAGASEEASAWADRLATLRGLGNLVAALTPPAPETVSQRVDRELAEDAVRAAAAFAAGRCWVCDRPLADYPSLESPKECVFCAEELRCQIAELREEV
jgi:hypothetical protein